LDKLKSEQFDIGCLPADESYFSWLSFVGIMHDTLLNYEFLQIVQIIYS